MWGDRSAGKLRRKKNYRVRRKFRYSGPIGRLFDKNDDSIKDNECWVLIISDFSSVLSNSLSQHLSIFYHHPNLGYVRLRSREEWRLFPTLYGHSWYRVSHLRSSTTRQTETSSEMITQWEFGFIQVRRASNKFPKGVRLCTVNRCSQPSPNTCLGRSETPWMFTVKFDLCVTVYSTGDL